ncbi:TIGR01620 family protein [Vibrio sp. UCD-FRSSP16_10]|uniref:YcjF family protein n=1 Tax=unclassified Vibrio TaxID=2614977 RepID=UPI0007FF2E39|nr:MULTISPECIES: TIGR01620 family protein [unclassified Vibrio]OBT13167.1 TIGR01620 family protein [Vibrio sp. UCD-FRSSP16_30]OBT19568.1 TIGR01620 family protein [Vibrio sp. UCD-FRSSP16_10]
MSEYKQKQVFTDTSNSSTVNDDKAQQSESAHYYEQESELGAKQTFSEHQFVKAELLVTTEQQPIEEKVQTLFNKKKVPLKWKLLFATLGSLSLWQLVDSFITSFQSLDYLSLAWTALVCGGAIIGAGALLRELIKMRRLRRQGDVQVQAQQIYDDNGYGNAKRFCEGLSHSLASKGVENIGLSKWSQHCTDNHSDRDTLDLYQGYVLSPIDQKVNRAIAKYSSEAAVMVSVSPLAAADMLLVAWRNISLINRIAKEYGVELGYWSRIQLLRLTLINMAAAGGTELALDAGMDLVSMDLTAKLSSRAAQGVGIGLLTARLGIKAVQLMRPIPFSEGNQLRLKDVRDQIFLSVKHRLQNSERSE